MLTRRNSSNKEEIRPVIIILSDTEKYN
jgi:hypothetical protein